MKVLALALICICMTFVSSGPTQRDRRSSSAMAMAGYPPYAGAFAGSGFWPFFPSPFDYGPRSFFPMPFPMFYPTKPWYEGDNVCITKKEMEDPKELQEWFSEVNSPSFDFNHESEQCQGNSRVYFCIKRDTKKGVTKMQATKYECCRGFVRNPEGSGCIESPSSSDQPSSNPRDKEVYTFVPKQNGSSSSSSSSSAQTGVDKVPAQ